MSFASMGSGAFLCDIVRSLDPHLSVMVGNVSPSPKRHQDTSFAWRSAERDISNPSPTGLPPLYTVAISSAVSLAFQYCVSSK